METEELRQVKGRLRYSDMQMRRNGLQSILERLMTYAERDATDTLPGCERIPRAIEHLKYALMAVDMEMRELAEFAPKKQSRK